MILSCFSSSIHRIQQVIDVATQQGAKSGSLGGAWWTISRSRTRWKNCTIPDGSVVRPQDIKSFDPKKIVVLASGSQAEPMSALSRIAVDNHRLIAIEENDTVILSARIIPGNEKAISRMIDHLIPAARARLLRKRPVGADTRLRPRQPGGNEAAPESREAQIFCSDSRRVSSTVSTRRAGASGRLRLRRNHARRIRAAHRIYRRWRRVPARTRRRGPRLRRFRLARRARRI